MRILVVGDVHGDFRFASKACRVAHHYGINTIIQVGDFGIWDHYDEGVYFLDELDKNAKRRGLRWIFLPGNHENYDRLENYETYWNESVGTESEAPYPEDFVRIRDNILYTRKVNTWEWEGQTFKAVGGAVSIDKMARTPGKSWWWQEQLTDDELARAVDLGRADFLFTHDCPTYAPFRGRLKPDPASAAHRQKINRVVEATKAVVHIHGHMHSFYDYENYDGGRIYGLECNDGAMWSGDRVGGQFRNMIILDTITDQVEFPDTNGM